VAKEQVAAQIARITVDYSVMGGNPCILVMRVTEGTVAAWIRAD
jgi:uncharacterized protein (DUF433 family)